MSDLLDQLLATADILEADALLAPRGEDVPALIAPLLARARTTVVVDDAEDNAEAWAVITALAAVYRHRRLDAHPARADLMLADATLRDALPNRDEHAQTALNIAFRALAIDPSHADALAFVERLFADHEELSVDEAVFSFPSNSPPHEALAARFRARATSTALPTYDQRVLTQADDLEAFFASLRALRDAGKATEAVLRYREAFAGFPGLAESHRAVTRDELVVPDGYVVPPAPVPAPPTAADLARADARALATGGDRMGAIRVLRERLGLSPAEAKAIVDAFAR